MTLSQQRNPKNLLWLIFLTAIALIIILNSCNSVKAHKEVHETESSTQQATLKDSGHVSAEHTNTQQKEAGTYNRKTITLFDTSFYNVSIPTFQRVIQTTTEETGSYEKSLQQVQNRQDSFFNKALQLLATQQQTKEVVKDKKTSRLSFFVVIAVLICTILSGAIIFVYHNAKLREKLLAKVV